MNARLVTVTLSCGHLTTADPLSLFTGIGVTKFDCFACGFPREWVMFRPCNQGYNLRCRNCRYVRSFGEARITCDTKAASHMLRKLHAVEVRLDDVVMNVHEPTHQLTLSDTAPF